MHSHCLSHIRHQQSVHNEAWRVLARHSRLPLLLCKRSQSLKKILLVCFIGFSFYFSYRNRLVRRVIRTNHFAQFHLHYKKVDTRTHTHSVINALSLSCAHSLIFIPLGQAKNSAIRQTYRHDSSLRPSRGWATRMCWKQRWYAHQQHHQCFSTHFASLQCSQQSPAQES